jgi:hypothetical protein
MKRGLRRVFLGFAAPEEKDKTTVLNADTLETIKTIKVARTLEAHLR